MLGRFGLEGNLNVGISGLDDLGWVLKKKRQKG